jgi:hypothetical protein
MNIRLWGLVALWSHSVTAGIIVPPDTITFGNGASCDFDSASFDIQDAIDAAASGDTIRITNEIIWLVPAGLVVANKSLTIVGGFSNCTDTTSDPNVPSVLNATGSSTTLTVSNAIAGVPTVLVRNIVLSGGDGGADKGGGVDLSGGILLRLDNVNVQNSNADYGGGIRVHGGPPIPTLSLEGGSLIGATSIFAGPNNAFLNGGGIYCDDGGLIEWEDASINFNSALLGGGMYLDGCTLTMPSAPGTELRTVEIRGNEVLQSGGGLMAINSSSLTLSSELNRQVRISNNKAGTGGGGIYLIGSDFDAAGLKLEQNEAGANGGAAYVFGSTFDMGRGNPTGANCPDRDRCATITRNHSTSPVGGVFATNSSVVDLRQVFVESNIGANVAALAVSVDATLILRDVQLAGNTATNVGGTRLISANDGTLDLRHVTAAANDVDMLIQSDNASIVTVHDSILWHPGIPTLGGDGTAILDLDCNNASENVTIAGAVTHTPGFLTGDVVGLPLPILHLAPASQNIDTCDDVPPSNPAFDLLGQMRVVDIPEEPDGAGPLDRGAAEYQPPLFKDSFEDL